MERNRRKVRQSRATPDKTSEKSRIDIGDDVADVRSENELVNAEHDRNAGNGIKYILTLFIIFSLSSSVTLLIVIDMSGTHEKEG